MFDPDRPTDDELPALTPYPAVPADGRTRDADPVGPHSPWPVALAVAVVLVCGFAYVCKLVTEAR